jgi:hypothetical protein
MQEAARWFTIIARRNEQLMISQSTITCPKCGHQAIETMPADACVIAYVCKGCGEELRPLAGDCCVFCSYGSVPCPSIQERRRA